MGVTNILEHLEETEKRVPDRTAFTDEKESVTYRALGERSRRAGSAAASAVPPRSAVAVIMDHRTADCVTALFAVLYAGCYYTVVDPALPAERVRSQFSTFRPDLILCDGKGAELAAAAGGGAKLLKWDEAVKAPVDEEALMRIRRQSREDDWVSVLYTSGSTGQPKGAVHTQAAYIRFTEATILKYGFTESEVFANQSPFFYANSIIDIFPSVALGAAVHILPGRLLTFSKLLIAFLREHRATELTMTPSSYVKIANDGVLTPGALPDLTHIILSGEAAPWPAIRQWMECAPNAGIWNFYGSTEAFSVAVWRLDRTYESGEIIPVGKPYDEIVLRFTDEDGNAAAPGEKGEMTVHTPWMSIGYCRDEERTAAVFRREADGRTYYRTGDIGRINEEGQLVVYGRRDQQIKRAGYRMELGEVEYALRACPGWQEGCCLYDALRQKLCCVWTGELTRKEIVSRLKKVLPRYAVPDEFLRLEELPHTATMKIDRRSLMLLLREKAGDTEDVIDEKGDETHV